MACLLLHLVLGVLFFSHFGQATRYLPMVVWDHLNPQLSCKCNWLTIPKIDKYDEIGFLCPSLKNVVKLLNGYSRPTSDMNEKIYKRKWVNGSENLHQLRDSLNDGSFCDPDQATVEHTCRDGIAGQSKIITFSPSSGFKIGDIVVFFNNGDGKVASLTSKKKHCTVVFMVNITSEVEVEHDMSYGKCLKPNDAKCDNINATCRSICQGCISQPSMISRQSSTPTKLERSSYQRVTPTILEWSSSQSSTRTKLETLVQPRVTPSKTMSRISSESKPPPDFVQRGTSDGLTSTQIAYGIAMFVAGICVGCFICFLLFLVHHKKAKAKAGPHYGEESTWGSSGNHEDKNAIVRLKNYCSIKTPEHKQRQENKQKDGLHEIPGNIQDQPISPSAPEAENPPDDHEYATPGYTQNSKLSESNQDPVVPGKIREKKIAANSQCYVFPKDAQGDDIPEKRNDYQNPKKNMDDSIPENDENYEIPATGQGFGNKGFQGSLPSGRDDE